MSAERMDRAMMKQPLALMGWMEALGDPLRLRLLRVLERHELGVAELCDVTQSPQSTVSRHLKVLGDGAWVRSRRQGTNRIYRLMLDELDAAARKLWLVAREQTDAWPAVKQDRLRLDRLLAAKSGDSQAFFAGAAGQWDRLRDELYGRAFTAAAVMGLLPADETIADLGCGTGPVTAAIAPFVRRVIGVDNSAAMLKAASKRLENLSNVELKRGELAALPLEDRSCDAALLVLALTYVADAAIVLSEMARILKPRGRAVVVDLLAHDREDFAREMGQTRLGFELRDVEKLMHESGLTAIKVRPLAPEVGAKGPAMFIATGSRG